MLWLKLSFLETCALGLRPSQVFPQDFFFLTVSFIPSLFPYSPGIYWLCFLFCFAFSLSQEKEDNNGVKCEKCFSPTCNNNPVKFSFLGDLAFRMEDPQDIFCNDYSSSLFSSFSYNPLLLYYSLVDEVIRYREVKHSIILWLNFCFNGTVF